MEYRLDKYGNKISVIGYGCMRFTQKAGKPDIDKTEKEIMLAYNNGVNYYDTAYIYPGSEAALGEILERNNIREKVKRRLFYRVNRWLTDSLSKQVRTQPTTKS